MNAGMDKFLFLPHPAYCYDFVYGLFPLYQLAQTRFQRSTTMDRCLPARKWRLSGRDNPRRRSSEKDSTGEINTNK